jgi:hypothetical protein
MRITKYLKLLMLVQMSDISQQLFPVFGLSPVQMAKHDHLCND